MENKIVKFADVKRWSNKQSVKKAVLKCLEQGQISGGKICADLERKVLKKFDYNFFSTTSSGTASLHLALLSLNIGSNHYVAVPDLTFVSTASSVLMVGAKPLLIDVEMDGNINLTSLEKACKEFEVKVVVAVHLYGNPCNLIELQRLSKKYNFIILEDCAQAIGACVLGKSVGTFGDLGTLSFYATKNLPGGEGGGVICKKRNSLKM